MTEHYLDSKKEGEIDLSLFAMDLKVCTRVASLYARNYYAWTYRTFLVNALPHESVRNIFIENI